MPPNTETTDGLLAIIRDRLLNFEPIGTDTRTLSDRLGTYSAGGVLVPRFWLETVPDDVAEDTSSRVNLWGLMQLIPSRQHGDDGRFMRRGMLEVVLLGRPRRAATELSGMADCVEQALFQWLNHDTQGGYIRPLAGLERSKIVYDDPSDRELGEIRLIVRLAYMPEFLTQYSSS